MKRTLSSFLIALLLVPFAPSQGQAATPSLLFSEILANAKNESTGEFIELYNASEVAIDLAGMTISDLGDTNDGVQEYVGQHKMGTSGTRLLPHAYALLVDPDYAGEYDAEILAHADCTSLLMLTVNDASLGNGLGNSADTITLKDAHGVVIDTHTWSADTGDGTSEGLIGFHSDHPTWKGSSALFGSTPGFANTAAPVATFSLDVSEGSAPLLVHFDGSDSLDPDGLPLQFSWDFGDGTNGTGVTLAHTFSTSGTYAVTLHITNTEGSESSFGKDVVVSATPEPPHLPPCALTLSEMLPNPVGDDAAGEFIELYNTSASSCALAGYSIDDGDGGSQPFPLPALTLPSHTYHAFHRKDTAVVLNNSNEMARILTADGTVLDSLLFSGTAPEGQSFARDADGEGVWTLSPTPFAPNIIHTGHENDHSPTDTLAETQTSSFLELGRKKIGTSVVAEGFVTALPGALSATTLYIGTTDGGIQIYSSQHLFPSLSLGTHVRVSGTLSEAAGERRVLIHAREDIQILSTKGSVVPRMVSARTLTTSMIGRLVVITGRVVEKNGSTLYLQDASGKIRVVLTEGSHVKSAQFPKYQTVRVVGIVSRTSSGIRVVPRRVADVTTGSNTKLLATGFLSGELFAALVVLILGLFVALRQRWLSRFYEEILRNFSSRPFW